MLMELTVAVKNAEHWKILIVSLLQILKKDWCYLHIGYNFAHFKLL